MLIRVRIIFLFILLSIAYYVEASQIYKCTNDKGKISFQDHECSGDNKNTPLPIRVAHGRAIFNNCKLINLPDEFNVYGVESYYGAKKVDIQLGRNGHDVRQAEIIVTNDEKPVVLALMSREPVLWKIKRSEGSKIAAIVVGGYYSQAVIGIEKSIPIKYLTYEDRADCGYFYKKSIASGRLKKITGKEIERFYKTADEGKIYIGRKNVPNNSLVYSNDYKVEDFVIKTRIPFGQKGIDYLVKEGSLRLATRKEWLNWAKIANEKFYKKKYPKLYREINWKSNFRRNYTYVVNRLIEIPDGLYGANSVLFIIPEGVPRPRGPKGHNGFYFMVSGLCEGPYCPK